jgi:hypothetical protein
MATPESAAIVDSMSATTSKQLSSPLDIAVDMEFLQTRG